MKGFTAAAGDDERTLEVGRKGRKSDRKENEILSKGMEWSE